MKTQESELNDNSNDALDMLYDAIASIQSNEEARQFFQDLCTPNEIQAMTDRWKVVAYLKEGMSYREIHAKTGVSITTIGRVARYLALGEGGYNLIYERLQQMNAIEEKD